MRPLPVIPVVGQASRLPPGRLAPIRVVGETPAQAAGTAAPLRSRTSRESWSQSGGAGARPRCVATPDVCSYARSGAETLAARTTTGRVRVLDLESPALECFDEIQFAPGDVERAFGVNHHFDATGIHKDIAIRRTVLQVHFVLQPRASAAYHRDAQDTLGTALPHQQRSYLLRGTRRHPDQSFVTHPIVGR